MTKKIVPTPYYHKGVMKSKTYEIYYNSDFSLGRIGKHTHSHYEFYFLISGSVMYTVDEKTYPLRPGDILLVKPEQAHAAFITENQKNYERYILWLNADYLKQLSSIDTDLLLPFRKINFSGSYLRLPHDMRLVFANLLQMILIQFNSHEYGADLLAGSYITELLIHIARIKLYWQPVYFERDIDNNPIVLRTLNYIAEHIRDDIGISDITNELCISRSRLSKIFSDCMGTSVHQYIIKKKLYLAKQELISGRVSVKTLCANYNFGDYSSFYRAFKTEFGMSPRKLVRDLKK
ncbi:helix-turn-helix domain-containing protein [Treponema parvum]|uniref:helix-turn-helix domain-containing protein n=1 Tax=Treponema parvum TaxID=138851 RepID=UPI001AEC1E28|nr:helix-turn-helix domain-containing protein [Treponema parvum]QTQ16024.1 AraC family transcriptional regulator [Treponema parvum]